MYLKFNVFLLGIVCCNERNTNFFYLYLKGGHGLLHRLNYLLLHFNKSYSFVKFIHLLYLKHFCLLHVKGRK